MSMRQVWTSWVLAGLLLVLGGCRPPFAKVEAVVDEGISFDWGGQLRVGRLDSDTGQVLPINADDQSLTFVVTATEEGAHSVWVNLEQDGAIVARGHGSVVFATEERQAQQVLLTTPCDDDTVCDDGLFCNENGTGNCREGHCVRYIPCQADIECATFVCNEDTDSCDSTVDHAMCNEGQAAEDPYYCDPSQGCRPGEGCIVDEDCQGARNCIAQFVCSNNRCVEQGPLVLEDGNECTQGSCEAPNGVLQEPRPDGELCTAAADGICVSGACNTSSCGDGYVDVDVRDAHPVAEECDDGLMFNSDEVPNACRTDCRRPYCGDGVTDPINFEECDDANDDDTDGCKNDCTASVCGDGVETEDEECDDGDDDNNDDCKNDCTENRCYDGVIDYTEEECDDGNVNPSDGCDACQRTEWTVGVTFGYGDGDSAALQTRLFAPTAVAADRAGNVFFAEATASIMRRYDIASEKISRVAGDGTFSLGGDGLPGTQNDASGVLSMDIDGNGNVVFADSDGNRVRKIDARTGIVTTLAGTGAPGFSGDGQLGTLAQLRFPQSVAVDGSGNVYVADAGNNRVRRIDGTTGIITTILGDGSESTALMTESFGVDFPGVEVPTPAPRNLALDGNDLLYVMDHDVDILIRVDLRTGLARKWAGTTQASGSDASGVIGPDAYLTGINALDVGPDHWVYFFHRPDHSLRRMAPGAAFGGLIETIAFGSASANFVGDNWAHAATAEASEASAISVGIDGTVYVADTGNQRVRAVRYDDDANQWQVNTMVGTDEISGAESEVDDRELIERVFRIFNGAIGLSIPEGQNGNPLIFIASERQHQVLYRPANEPAVYQLAGTGIQGYSGDGGHALNADLNGPAAVAYDQFTNVGRVYIADRGNHVIRAVEPDGTISTVVGTGIAGDNAPPPNFNGTWDAPALSTHLNYPSSVGVDGSGRVWIADARNGRIVRYDPADGMLSLIPTTAGALPWGLYVLPLDQLGVSGFNGNLVVYADRGNNQVRFLAEFQRENDNEPLRLNQLIAGTGAAGYLDHDDGGLAILEYPRAVLPYTGDDCDTCFVFADGFDRVRQLELTLNLPASVSAKVTTSLGGARPEGSGGFDIASMVGPQHLVPISDDGTFWLASDGVQGTLHLIDFSAPQVLLVAGFPEGFTQGDNATRPVYTKKLNGVVQLAYDATQDPPVAYAAVAGDHIIRRLTMPSPTQFANWTIDDFAGEYGKPGFADGTLAAAQFNEPAGLALDAEQQILYVAERGNHVVRAIDLQNPDAPDAVTTVAGTPQSLGFFGDGTSAREATFHAPSALAFFGGRLYIADTENNRVRYVDDPMQPASTVHTLVGDGSPASGGKGPLARTFPVDNPQGVHIDRYGNAFVTSRSAVRTIAAGDDGLADGDDPTDLIYGAGARDRYPEPVTRCLSGLSTSLDGAKLYVFDACQGLMVELTRQQVATP